MKDGETGRWHDAGPVTQFPKGVVSTVRVAGRRLAMGQDEYGFFALDDECPHLGGSLGEGMLDGGYVICPLHSYGFHLHTGACEDADLCAETWPVRTVGERVEVCLPEPASEARSEA